MRRKREMTEAERLAYEERKARRRAIAKQIEAMTPAEREALAATVRVEMIDGHECSPFNTCFVIHQQPDATLLGGSRQWREHGRKIRKGAKSVAIWRPIGNKDENGEIVQDDELQFALVSVFDVTQTEEIGTNGAPAQHATGDGIARKVYELKLEAVQ